ncbi:MAG: hypothetical protein KKF12_12285 [Proteobacteria bacterium]|nr:hypothetical protein [Desulfobacula sp.]MBU3951023.1 hypothetical protein [Pseudomonadota bacterium]MBU4131591.1 hypothetical protein [Pseudomonadota bacterium]
MAKQKPPEREKIRYLLKAGDWSTDYGFYFLDGLPGFVEAGLRERSQILIKCNIEYPTIKTVHSAEVQLYESHWLDKHIEQKSQNKEIVIIGKMDKAKGCDLLIFTVFVSSRLFQNISFSLAFEKTKWISVYGDKLKWGKGDIYSIDLKTKKNVHE